MADNVTAGTQAAGFDRSAGFGSTERKDDNSEQINDLLDQARDLMIEDGADPATAEALTNFARPSQPAISGNLADLMRMGQVAVKGEIDTPAGEPNIEATSLDEAFTNFVPPAPDLNTGLQTPMGQIDAEGKPTGVNVGDETAAPAEEAEAEEEGGYETWSKAELQGALDEQGIAYTSSDNKADLIAKLEGA